jgi:hypothetical protein
MQEIQAMSKTQSIPKDEAPIAPPDAAPEIVEAVRGRALVDLPAFGLACGAFGEVPSPDAESLIAGGQFDDKAPWPEE